MYTIGQNFICISIQKAIRAFKKNINSGKSFLKYAKIASPFWGKDLY
jgi:hypothetical protein